MKYSNICEDYVIFKTDIDSILNSIFTLGKSYIRRVEILKTKGFHLQLIF